MSSQTARRMLGESKIDDVLDYQQKIKPQMQEAKNKAAAAQTDPHLRESIMNGHGRYVGSCGHTITQCRCPKGNHPGAIQVEAKCERCASGVVESKDKALPVIVAERAEKYHVCPHCNVEIFEKHTYSPDRGVTWKHRDCDGTIIMPESEIPIEEIQPWLRSAVQAVRDLAKEGKPLW